METTLKKKAIKDMDINSRFFHAVASVRHRRKKMVQIRNGRRITRSPRMITVAIRNFFKDLYKHRNVLVINFQAGPINKIS